MNPTKDIILRAYVRVFYMICRHFYSVLLVSLFIPLTGWSQRQVKKIDSTEIVFQNHLLEALEQRLNGYYDRAIESLDICNKIHSNAVVVFEYTKNQVLSKDYISAISSFDRLLRKEPNNLLFLKELLRYFKEKKKSDMAQDLVDRLAKEDISFRGVQVWTYYYLGKYNKTLSLLQDTKGGITQNTIDSLRVLCIIKSKKNETPIRSIKPKSKEKNPIENIRKMLQRLMSENKFTELERYTRNNLDSYPTLPILYYAMGWVQLKKDQPNKAIYTLLSALDYLVEDKVLEKKIYIEISKAYKMIGKSIKSEEYLQKSKKL